MKELYERTQIELLAFEAEDIVTTSGLDDNETPPVGNG